MKHNSSAQHNWVWWSLTAAASDTISALFTHAQTQHIQTPREKKNIAERLLFYCSGDAMEFSVKAHEGINLVSEMSPNMSPNREKNRQL